MNDRDFFDLGELGRQVKDTVKSAFRSEEFSDLKQTIQSTVRDIQDSIRGGFSVQEPEPPHADPGVYGYTDPEPVPPPASPAAGKARKKAPRLKAPGSTAGVLLTVFGGIGLGLVFLAALIVGLAVLVEEDASFSAGLSLGVFLPLLLLCVGLLAAGGRLRSRARRYRQYRARIGGASFCPIELLASYTGNTPRFVAKDLRKMIRLGLFPDAHIDEEETCLMLNYETYRYYQEAKRRQEEEKQRVQDAPSAEIQKLIEEERQILQQIRACNDAIPGEEISASIAKLETTAGAIFQYVEEHPAKLPEIRRFLNYYLPTTLKLLDAYQKFSSQPVQSGQQEETIQQIEDAMDTINQAFVNLLNSLMEAERMDVSADISVMKSMLEQEGLSGDSPAGKPQP